MTDRRPTVDAPRTNLTVALAMADHVEQNLGWCRWRPWTTRDRSVCG